MKNPDSPAATGGRGEVQHQPADRTSLRAAINGKCRDCIYDRCAPGNWRQQVEACTSPACALYPVRPVSKGAKTAPEIDAEAVLA